MKHNPYDQPRAHIFHPDGIHFEVKEPESVNHEADGLIHNARNKDYGHPLDDFSAQAQMWSAYLSKKYKMNIILDYADVALMMVMVKVARHAQAPKRDNLVDICGYAGCLEMCENEEAARHDARVQRDAAEAGVRG